MESAWGVCFLVYSLAFTSADLEVQLMQLNHCDGVLSNHLKYLIRATNISAYSNLYVYIRPCISFENLTPLQDPSSRTFQEGSRRWILPVLVYFSQKFSRAEIKRVKSIDLFKQKSVQIIC